MGEGEGKGGRRFTWEGRDDFGLLRVVCGGEAGTEQHVPDYDHCHCDACTEIEEITEEEVSLRAGYFGGALLIEAGSDLFLMEKDRKRQEVIREPLEELEDETPAEVLSAQDTAAIVAAELLGRKLPPIQEDPVLDVLDVSKKTSPEDLIRKMLDAARAVVGKLRVMSEQKRADTFVSMRDAYYWIFSDDRVVFRAAREEAERVDTGLVCPVDVCYPFLLACEASRVDPDWFRAKVVECMKAGGFTVESLKEGMFAEVVVAETCTTCERVCNNAGDNAEACADHKITNVMVSSTSTTVMSPAPASVSKPAEDSMAKINRWFKSIKKAKSNA